MVTGQNITPRKINYYLIMLFAIFGNLTIALNAFATDPKRASRYQSVLSILEKQNFLMVTPLKPKPILSYL